MNEPHLIRNDSPHQVSMAEGTNQAFGKKAEALASLEQTVTVETDAPVIEHSLQDAMVVVPETVLDKSTVEQPTFERQLKVATALVPVSDDKSESMALAPEPLSVQPAVVFVPEAPMAASPAQGPALATPPPSPPPVKRLASADTESPALSEAMERLIQMDFPARVINLKIKNDKVRSTLDALQASIRN